MGFRNPARSAVAVDTRAGAPAGVRVYEVTDPDVGHNYGVVEWNDGVPGDAPAIAIQSHDPTPRGEGVPYGGLGFFGGSYDNPIPAQGGKVSAPRWSLEVGQNPLTGTPGPQARLTGGPLLLDRPVASTGAAEQWADLPYIAGAWAPFDAGANAPRMRRDVAGNCQLRGIVKILLGSGFSIAAAGSATVGTLPAGFYLPGANAWGVSAIISAAGSLLSITQAFVGPTGVLTVVNNTASALGANTAFTLGLSYPTT